MSRRVQVYKLRGDFKSLVGSSPFLHRFHLSTLEINDLSFSRHWRSNLLETVEEHNLKPPSLNFKGMEREKWKKKMEMELRDPRDVHGAAQPVSMSSSSNNNNTISIGNQWGQTETMLTRLSRKILPSIKWFLKPRVAGSRLSCQK